MLIILISVDLASIDLSLEECLIKCFETNESQTLVWDLLIQGNLITEGFLRKRVRLRNLVLPLTMPLDVMDLK